MKLNKKKLTLILIMLFVSVYLLITPFIKNKLIRHMSDLNTTLTKEQFAKHSKKK